MSKKITTPVVAALTVVQNVLLGKILNSEYHSVPMAERANAPTWRVATLLTDSDRAVFAELEKLGMAGSDCSSKKEEEHTVFVTETGFKAHITANNVPATPADAKAIAKKLIEDAKAAGKAAKADKTPIAAKTEKTAPAPKAAKKNPPKTGGLGIGQYWLTLFRQNEAAFASGKTKDVLTDEDITAELNRKFPGRNSQVFADVRLVRNRCNAQTNPGTHGWVKGETFSRFVKHEGKIVKATQRGVPLNDDGTPIVKAVEAPAPKAIETPVKVAKKAKAAPVVAKPKAKMVVKAKKAAK